MFKRKPKSNEIATFEKVSYEQFKKSLLKYNKDEILRLLVKCDKYVSIDKKNLELLIRGLYDCIKLPTRKTYNSAGYDFNPPFPFSLNPGESITIPTGIKCNINLGWFMMLAPRSGCGKYRVQFDDIMPIIDGDYYNCAENEGNIILHITNDNKENKTVSFNNNKSFIQGIFIPYGLTKDDYKHKKKIRVGGYGSTNTKGDK